MGNNVPTVVLAAVAGWALLWHTGESGAQPVLATGPEAEITEDGLHPLDQSVMGAAWVRPDLDLSRYARIFAGPTAVQFRDVPERWYTMRTLETATEFHVSDTMQARLRELFRESFDEAISAVRSYEPTEEVGRDVLMVQGFLTDVISGVPPDLPGSVVTDIKWAWEVNIVLELRDSMSDEVLARTVERQRMDGPLYAGMVWALTPSIVDGWSRLLIRRLEGLTDLYPSRLSRLQELGRN